MGHLMRSSAVAEEAQARGIPVSLMAPLGCGRLAPAWLVPSLVGIQEGRWLDDVQTGDVVLFDGYGIDDAEIAAAADKATVGYIDDHAATTRRVDLLVVPSFMEVRAEHAGIVLAGPRYAPVSRRVLELRRPAPARTQRLLVTLGGTDVGGLGGRIVDALPRANPFPRTTVLLGPMADAGRLPARLPPGVEVLRGTTDAPALFAACDAALSAAGSTVWELLCIGVPTALVACAANQMGVAATTLAAGAAIDLGPPDDITDTLPAVLDRLACTEARSELVGAGHRLVDGFGAARIVDALLASSSD